MAAAPSRPLDLRSAVRSTNGLTEKKYQKFLKTQKENANTGSVDALAVLSSPQFTPQLYRENGAIGSDKRMAQCQIIGIVKGPEGRKCFPGNISG